MEFRGGDRNNILQRFLENYFRQIYKVPYFNSYMFGWIVEIEETKPISKDKKFKIIG